MQEVLGLVLASAVSAFIDIGVFVGAVLLLFGYINYRMAGALVESIAKSKKWQPVLGALLGATPGCGVAIFLKPLFVRGSIRFGAVIAALIATTGDSAFVMLATIPHQYVVISAMAVVLAVITGYLVDRTTLGTKLVAAYARRRADRPSRHPAAEEGLHCHAGGGGAGRGLRRQTRQEARGHSLVLAIAHRGYPWYWLLLGAGLVLGILGLFQVDVDALFIPNLGLVLGTAGTVLSIGLMLAGRQYLDYDPHEEAGQNAPSWQEILIRNARETAFVITWVFVGLLAYELVVLVIGGGN